MELPISSFQPNLVPNQLRDKITVQQWNEICVKFQEAEQTGHLFACVGECMCCMLVGCWPIFFCHPCIAAGITRSRRDNVCHNLNRNFFNGTEVLRQTASGILINCDRIGPQLQVAPQIATAQYAPQAQYVPQHAPPMQASYPVNSQPINMPANQNVYYTPNSDYIPIANAVAVDSVGNSAPLSQPAKYYEATPVTTGGRIFELQVPMNAVPGQSVVAYVTPDGRPGEIVVPRDWVTGSLLRIPY